MVSTASVSGTNGWGGSSPPQPKYQEAPTEADAALNIFSPLFPKLGVTVQKFTLGVSTLTGSNSC